MGRREFATSPSPYVDSAALKLKDHENVKEEPTKVMVGLPNGLKRDEMPDSARDLRRELPMAKWRQPTTAQTMFDMITRRMSMTATRKGPPITVR